MPTNTGPQDRSLEIATRLQSASAILDLLSAVNGSRLDGSDCKIDDLDERTLSRALYCARHNIIEAEALQIEHDRFVRATQIRAA